MPLAQRKTGDIENKERRLTKANKIEVFNRIIHYTALACGRCNARSDWQRARSERSLCSRSAHCPITDYGNQEERDSGNSSALKT